MILYFLRHGDASTDPLYKDSDRPLTELGGKQAEKMGKFLSDRNIHFDIVLSSPMLRARQTTSIVLKNKKDREYSISKLLLNGINPQELVAFLNGRRVSAVLLVGHIPHLEKCIALIAGGIEEDDFNLKKCSLAVIEAQYPIRPGSGKLIELTHVDSISDFMET